MSRSIKTKSEHIFPEIVNLLQSGRTVDLRVTGNSMFPFFRHGHHVVQLVSVGFRDLVCGDVVLIQRTSGAFVLHRVVKLEDDTFYIAGDAQKAIEGPLLPDQLIAVVCKVKNGDRIVDPSDIKWKLYSSFYRKRSFLRNIIISLFSRFSRHIVCD